jgi:hypothetical protein
MRSSPTVEDEGGRKRESGRGDGVSAAGSGTDNGDQDVDDKRRQTTKLQVEVDAVVLAL